MYKITQKMNITFIFNYTFMLYSIFAGTVTIQGNGNIVDDARIVSIRPNYNGGGDSWGNVTFFTSNNNIERTYIRIPIPSFITYQYANSITNSNLKVYILGLESGPFDISINEVTSDWSEYLISWSNRPSHDPLPLDTFTLVQENVWVDFAVTDLVKEWVGEEKPNYGFVLKPAIESPPIQDLSAFWSSDCLYDTLRPVLEITSPQLPDTFINNYVPLKLYSQEYNETPLTYILYQNFPNPFNSTTLIKFKILKKSKVFLTVFDINGKIKSILLDGEKLPGIYQIEFNGQNLASGVYYYRLKVNENVSTKKLILMK